MLSPSKAGTGSSVFRPALAGGAAQEPTKTNQINRGRRRGPGLVHSRRRCPEGWDAGSTKGGSGAQRDQPGSRDTNTHKRLGPFARTLWREGRRQSATPTSASATTSRASLEFETHRIGHGVEKRSAWGTTGTSDLVKALAGGAHWRGPADATWSRVSRRAALPTATTKVASAQSVVLQGSAGIRSHCAKSDRKLRFRQSLPQIAPPEVEETQASAREFRSWFLLVRKGSAWALWGLHPVWGLFLDKGGRTRSIFRGLRCSENLGSQSSLVLLT